MAAVAATHALCTSSPPQEAAAANVGAAADGGKGAKPAKGSAAATAAAAKKPAAPAVPPAALLSWRDTNSTRTAVTLFAALYESLVRVTAGPFSAGPGIARAFLETVAPGEPTARGLSSPASVIWSSVLSLRLLEVRGERAEGT